MKDKVCPICEVKVHDDQIYCDIDSMSDEEYEFVSKILIIKRNFPI